MQSFDDLLDHLTILTERSLVHDHRRVTVQAMTSGKARIITGRPLAHTDRYYDLEDGWCYPSHQAALDALAAWNPEKDKGPDGWHRHVGTGRYRIDARDDLEYVKEPYGETLEEVVAYALSVTHGEDRVVKDLKETRAGDVFPFGTTRYVVMSENSTCPHDPKCQPIDMIYQRWDRWVVLSLGDFFVATIDNVLRRLKSDNEEPWNELHTGYLADLYGVTVYRVGQPCGF